MKNTYENSTDVKRMQEEAFKRVQEMQKRAKLSLERSQPYTLKRPSEPPQNESKSPLENLQAPEKMGHEIPELPTSVPEIERELKPKAEATPTAKDAGVSSMFSHLLQDSEKSLIILLLMLLVEEDTDVSLVMALMHLIL